MIMKFHQGFSPGAFDAEGVEIGGFLLVEIMLDELVDAGAAWAAAEARAQFGQIFDGAASDNLDVAVFGVAYPAAQIEFAGFAVDKPAEPHSLYASANQKVKNHRTLVFQMGFKGSNRGSRARVRPVRATREDGAGRSRSTAVLRR
jgi:hypothetical protein